MNDGLTQKQENFCLEYIKSGNGSGAYRKAYDASGMTDEAVNVEASRLLDNPKIILRLDDLRDKAEAKSLVTVGKILRELHTLATVDIRQAFDEQGNLKAIKDLPEDVARAIASIESFEEYSGRGDKRDPVGYTRKIRMVDKIRALELCGKHLKMFTDKVEHTAPEGGPVIPPVIIFQPVRSLTELEQMERLEAEGGNAAPAQG